MKKSKVANLYRIAERLKKCLQQELGITIGYDEKGIDILSQTINICHEQKAPPDGGLAYAMGCFFGRCIMEHYGGNWLEEDVIDVANGLIAHPLSMVSKHLKYGEEDDVRYKFAIIPAWLDALAKNKVGADNPTEGNSN